MFRCSAVSTTNSIILLVFCINVNSQYFREDNGSATTEATNDPEDSVTTTTTTFESVTYGSTDSVATVINDTTNNDTTDNVTIYDTTNSPKQKDTMAFGPKNIKVLKNLTMEQINKVPLPLLPYLFRAYSEALEDDENTMSLRRFHKHNKEYEIHVQKLKEVNGYKRHNLMIKEIGRNNDNPLIYINNPVEAKLPNAYLSLESFKKALENRANNDRGKGKVVVINKDSTKKLNSNKIARPLIKISKPRFIQTTYKITKTTEVLKSIKNVTTSTIIDKSKTIQDKNMLSMKLHKTNIQKISDNKLTTKNEGTQTDVTTHQNIIKEIEKTSEATAETQGDTSADNREINIYDNDSSTTFTYNTIPVTTYTATKTKKHLRFKNTHKSSRKNTIKKRTTLGRPLVFVG